MAAVIVSIFILKQIEQVWMCLDPKMSFWILLARAVLCRLDVYGKHSLQKGYTSFYCLNASCSWELVNVGVHLAQSVLHQLSNVPDVGRPMPAGPHSPDASRRHATCTSPLGRPHAGSSWAPTGLADLAEAASAYGHNSPSPMRRLSHAVERLEREDLRAAATAGLGSAPGLHGRDALARLLGLARAVPEPIYSHRGPSGGIEL